MTTAGSTTSERETDVSFAVRVARQTAWISGLFCVFVAGLLLFDHARLTANHPLETPALEEAKATLRADPLNEELTESTRELDLDLRRRFFAHLLWNRGGGWLLLAGLSVFVISVRLMNTVRPRWPSPKPMTPDARVPLRQARLGRRSVLVAALVVAGVWAWLGGSSRSVLPKTSEGLAALFAENEEEVQVASTTPPLEQVLRQWPRFRGPWGDGRALEANPPLRWDGTTGEGIRWKAAIPLPGQNSPVVWERRVFLTGGDENAREVFCYDTETGDLIWRRPTPPLARGLPEDFEVPEFTGYAACTAATDGQRVFAMFVTGELVAFDFAGDLVWSKPLGIPDNMYGHATSLLVWDGKLLVQFDQGEAEAGKSRLYALDPATGDVIWEQKREVPSTWTTPTVVKVGDPIQLIVLSEPWAMGYELSEGRELWRAECLGTDLAPSAIEAGGLVVVCSPGMEITAIRPDGQGNVTDSHIAWRSDEYVPDIASPVADDKHIYVLTTYGELAVLASATGELLAEREFEMDFNASPTLAGDRIYLISLEGVTIVLKSGAEAEELARCELGAKVHASPAFVGDRIYVRGNDHLFCIDGVTPAP